MGIGTTLYNLTVIPIGDGAVRRRKKRRGSPTSDEFDIILNTISQYFEMNFGEPFYLLFVCPCLINFIFKSVIFMDDLRVRRYK